jgi:hypothetical protein
MLLALVRERHPDRYEPVAGPMRWRDEIEKRMPVEWIPIVADVELLEQLHRHLPWAAIEELLRERQRQEMGSALFKTFVATIGKLMGLTPLNLVRQLPKGWTHVFADCGEVQVRSVGDHTADVVVAGLPAVCAASLPWRSGVPVGMSTLYELVGVTRGRVEHRPSASNADIALTFEW